MKNKKEIIINIKEPTIEYQKLRKDVDTGKITEEEMKKNLNRNYREKGVSYEKYNKKTKK